MKIYIINSQIDIKAKELLNKYGTVAEVAAHPTLPEQEKCHADMQFARLDNHTLICAPGSSVNNASEKLAVIPGSINLKEKYPYNISYNILRCGDLLIHNTKHTAPEILSEAHKRQIKILHVNQGYAGCSSISIPLADKSTLLLSSDKGIISAIKKSNTKNIITEYFEDTDNIILPGYNHGFIGGCCGYDNQLGLIVYGKTNRQLNELSERYNFPIFPIFDGPLTDIGGILVMYPLQ